MLRIAITKGRITKNTIKLFEKKGLDVNSLINPGRKSILETNEEFEYYILKSKDVINIVKKGFADLGVIGNDSIIENYESNIKEIADFETGICRFVLAGKKDFELTNGIKIATKYPNIANEYLKRKKINAEIVKMDGNLELAPLIGYADAIIDIVETGTSLKENNLQIFAEIGNISTRLITNDESIENKIEEIIDFINRTNIKNLMDEKNSNKIKVQDGLEK